jgi:hypothetical protein
MFPQFGVQGLHIPLELRVVGFAKPAAQIPMIVRNMDDSPPCMLEHCYSIKVGFGTA